MIPNNPECAGKSVFRLFMAMAPPLIFGAKANYFFPFIGR